MKRRLAPLLNPSLPSVRKRLVALAVLGVGLPILFLAGLGIFQTSHIARFLRETTLEYGEYAALLVSNALHLATAKSALSALQGCEARLKAHVYMECEILFPKALAMEASLLQRNT